MDNLPANLNLFLALGGGVLLLGILAFFLRDSSPAVDNSVDAKTADAAKARLGTLTGLDFGDSKEDLEDARPKSAPPLPPPSSGASSSLLGGSTMGGGAAEAVLTQYTSGDGKGVDEMMAMLEKDPDNLQLLDWLAFMYYSNNQTGEAIETYGRIIAIDPTNASQHYYLANSFYKANRINEALEHWRKVCTLKPDGKLARKAGDRIKKVEEALS